MSLKATRQLGTKCQNMRQGRSYLLTVALGFHPASTSCLRQPVTKNWGAILADRRQEATKAARSNATHRRRSVSALSWDRGCNEVQSQSRLAEETSGTGRKISTRNLRQRRKGLC